MIVERARQVEPSVTASSEESCRQRLSEIRRQVDQGASVDVSLQSEVVAMAAEAIRRTCGIRLHDVQLLAAVALHDGRVIDMKTGEGKTVAAVPAAVLGALDGSGIHVVTTTDFLAETQGLMMASVFSRLGLSCGILDSTTRDDVPARQRALGCDVTYGSFYEFGFDYLYDNLIVDPRDRRQRDLSAAIVDEVDAILIDDAQTPLLVAGSAAADRRGLYRLAARVRRLVRGVDYEVDERKKLVAFDPSRLDEIEATVERPGLFGGRDLETLHRLHRALEAEALYLRDRDYILHGGVQIVDASTGHVLTGRRWPNGLHQAVEAKEGMPILDDPTARARITVQSYFSMYRHLAGMSGSAALAGPELRAAYGLDTITIPTNRSTRRVDLPDRVYATEQAKLDALVAEVEQCHGRRQPVLVGARTVAAAERISVMLAELGIDHETLTAKNEAREADVVSRAGRLGAVTIATPIAGRGIDIKLEDNEVGLVVLGVEHHHSRRVDSQLAGRSGRQGDPGEAYFFGSPDDDLLTGRRLNPRRLQRTLARAQREREQEEREDRRLAARYEKVIDRQRTVIYGLRRRVVAAGDDGAAPGRPDATMPAERLRLLDSIDLRWSDHLFALEVLRDGAQLRAAAQLDPRVEWEREADLLFQDLLGAVRTEAGASLAGALG